MSLITFHVRNGNHDCEYQIKRENIENFPLEDTYLQVLLRQYDTGTMKVNTKDECIILESHISYFDKIVRIYDNSSIKLVELFDVDFSVLEKLNESRKKRDMEESDEKDPFKEKLLDDVNFQEFLEDLKFYGLYDLFENKEDIDVSDFKRRVYRRLANLFGSRTAALHFLNNLSRIDAHISGSFLLQAIYGEVWENSDIDIYVNEAILINFYKNFFHNTHEGRNSNKIKFRQKSWLPEVEKKIDLKRKPEQFAEDVAMMLGENFKVVRVPEKRELDEGYGICKNLVSVIKLQYNGDNSSSFNVDFVIVNCTVPYFIAGFDFSFNKIYFDSYTIHAFDWKSILTKKSINYYKYDRYIPDKLKYLQNIKRIKKYFSRGFVITYKGKDQVENLFNNDDLFGDDDTISTAHLPEVGSGSALLHIQH
jgi:hypothetical protein